MATRDYVKRGKRPRKSVQRRKAPSVNNSLFKLKLVLAVVVFLAAFIYLLSSLSPNEQLAPQVTPSQPSTSIKSTAPAANENLLPPKPEEKWSYIETLENKKVQVEENAQEVPSRPYLMQCGAYKDEAYAEIRKANIAFQGYESQIKKTETENSIWYRVVLGPYDLKRKAESDRNHLRRAGIEPCKIWFWED